MAVAFDAKSTASVSWPVTATTTALNLTVGAGANRALIIAFTSGATLPVVTSATWDTAAGGTNQAMTLIGSIARTTVAKVWLYGLLAPTSGLKQFKVAYTGTGNGYIQGISFTGVDQGAFATSFTNFATNVGGASTGSLSVTTAANDAAVAVWADANSDTAPGTLNQTTWFSLATLTPNATGQDAIIASGTSVSFTNSASAANWAYGGVNLVAVGQAGGDVLFSQIIM